MVDTDPIEYTGPLSMAESINFGFTAPTSCSSFLTVAVIHPVTDDNYGTFFTTAQDTTKPDLSLNFIVDDSSDLSMATSQTMTAKVELRNSDDGTVLGTHERSI